MKRILYGVSPIGLGHATRASAVMEMMKSAGADVLAASGGYAAQFLRDRGCRVEDVIREPVPSVVGGEMKWATLWYLKYWRGYRRSRKAMEGLIDRFRPDLVVGDEEFSGVSVAMQRKLNHALMTDELELGFARSVGAKTIESRVLRWYQNLVNDATVVVIPDEGQDNGNRRHVGPVVRRVTKTKEEVVREHSLPLRGSFVLLSLSGSGIGGHLFRLTSNALGRASVPDSFLAVSGNRGRSYTGENVHDLGFVLDNQNLVAAADLVVSTAGKSTIDEAASSGTPMIAVPIRNHAEQERNAAALGYTPDIGRNLGELVAARIGRREAPKNFDGAERASSLLLSMI
jgi:UDP-N-acetylglucosamine--N-acetylmuramyl-(pentapeptide) pyrophosphoryl-undecaprenol N-acetylglucosamine transferase